jgi:hypothetical protein
MATLLLVAIYCPRGKACIAPARQNDSDVRDAEMEE